MKWMIYPVCALAGAAIAAGIVSLFGGDDAVVATRAEPNVRLVGVQGASGDGNTALSASLRTLLQNAEIALVDQPNRCTVTVSAEVSTQRRDQTDRVSILWQVHDGDGRMLGEVAQINAVPSGSLDQGWGRNATQAAQGARAGILDILKRRPVCA